MSEPDPGTTVPRATAPGGQAGLDPAVPVDHLDGIVAQWARERPELDTWPMGVIGRLKRLTSMLAKAHEDVWSRHGLDEGLFDVLAALRRAGEPHLLSPTELYDSLLISSATITHRLSRLAAEDLIVRVPNPRDGRGMLVQLTDKGRRTVDAVVEDFLAQAGTTLEVLTESDRADVARILRQLLVSLGDSPAPGAPIATIGEP